MNVTARGAIADLSHLIRAAFGRSSKLDRQRYGAHRVVSRVRVGEVLLGIPARWPSWEPFRTNSAVVTCLCGIAFVAASDSGAELMYARHLEDPRWPDLSRRADRIRTLR